MRQAIITRYLPATMRKGSRIKAEASSGSVTVPYDYELDTNGNHTAAARALAEKLAGEYPHGPGWRGYWLAGGAPNDRGNVYVRFGSDYLPPVQREAIGKQGSDWFFVSGGEA